MAKKGLFRRQFMTRLRKPRLGDLLLKSRLVSKTQLDHALFLQSQNHEPLGKILIREGYVSALSLYRKLIQQWVLRVTAACMALILQSAAPGALLAPQVAEGSEVRLALAFSPAAAKGVQDQADQESPFHGADIKSDNISAFPKWISVINRYEEEIKSRSERQIVSSWQKHLNALIGKTDQEKLEGVNDFVNSLKYVEDKNNYGLSDYWATPLEFLANGGDCEDFAIAKYASLRALGFAPDQLRIAVVEDEVRRVPHAILIVYSDDRAFVLDNQDKTVRLASDIDRYTPIFSINTKSWWLHRA